MPTFREDTKVTFYLLIFTLCLISTGFAAPSLTQVLPGKWTQVNEKGVRCCAVDFEVSSSLKADLGNDMMAQYAVSGNTLVETTRYTRSPYKERGWTCTATYQIEVVSKDKLRATLKSFTSTFGATAETGTVTTWLRVK